MSCFSLTWGQGNRVDDFQNEKWVPIWEKIDLTTGNDLYLVQKYPQKIIEDARESLNLFPKNLSKQEQKQYIHTKILMAGAYRYLGRYDSSQYILEKLQRDFAGSIDPFNNRNLCFQLCGVYLRILELPKLLETTQKLRVITESLGDSLSKVFYHVTNYYAYSNQGLIFPAIKALQEADNLLTGPQNSYLKQMAQTNLGAFFIRNARYEDALRVYEKLLPMINPDNGNPIFIISSGNYILALSRLGRHHEALAKLEEVSNSVNKTSSDYFKAYHKILFVENYFYLEQVEKAEPYIREVDTLLKSSQKLKLFGYNCLIKGYIEEQKGNLSQALDLYKQSTYTASPSRSFGSLDESYLALAQVSEKMGRDKDAQNYLRRLTFLKDSIFNAWQGNIDELLQITDSLHQNTIQIRKLESQQKVQTLRGRILVAIIILILLIASLSIAVLRNYFIRKREEGTKRHNAQLKAYASELEDMAYATSHYLKEPVRGVGAYAGLIQQKLASKVDPEEKADLAFLGSAAQRLSILMAELSNFFKLGNNLPAAEEVDTEFLIESLRKQAINKHQLKNDAIVLSGKFPVLAGHKNLLEKLFWELVDNAIKFGREQEVELQITYTSNRDTHTFEFRDHGIGIEERYWEKVFQIFYQVDPYSDKPGVGIGLSKVRKIMRIYNGQIQISGEKNSHTLITLTFPKSPLA